MRRKPARKGRNGAGSAAPVAGAATPSPRKPPRRAVSRPSRPPVSTSIPSSAEAMSSSGARSMAGTLPDCGRLPAVLFTCNTATRASSCWLRRDRAACCAPGSITALPPLAAIWSTALRIAAAAVWLAPWVSGERPWNSSGGADSTSLV